MAEKTAPKTTPYQGFVTYILRGQPDIAVKYWKQQGDQGHEQTPQAQSPQDHEQDTQSQWQQAQDKTDIGFMILLDIYPDYLPKDVRDKATHFQQILHDHEYSQAQSLLEEQAKVYGPILKTAYEGAIRGHYSGRETVQTGELIDLIRLVHLKIPNKELTTSLGESDLPAGKGADEQRKKAEEQVSVNSQEVIDFLTKLK